jgi:origin recognition complex subunit 5
VSERLDFELPYMSKYLLVAAYIASRNHPSPDRRVFNISSGKKRRRSSFGAMQADSRADAAKAAALAAPGR